MARAAEAARTKAAGRCLLVAFGLIGPLGCGAARLPPPEGAVHAYSEALRENAARHNLASATTCDPGLVTWESDSLLLPRFVDTMSVSDATFVAWVTGGAVLLPRRRMSGSVTDAR